MQLNIKFHCIWSPEALTAVQDCKNNLANATLLVHPSYTAPLCLHLPISFFSRKFTSAQAKYSTYDRELLAIYTAVKYFRYLLEARTFSIFTDHKPLIFAFKQKLDKASRQARYLELVFQFSTDILYISGKNK